ncbi:MAG: amidohydrolase family protein [Pseudohongiellaceae bacterium]
MTAIIPGSEEWLRQVREEILEPERPIIDPHHHLWRDGRLPDYMLDQLWQDTGSGHNIVKTVFLECRAFYYQDGPVHLRPAGETETVAEIARQSRESTNSKAVIAGIVSHADLTLAGETEELLLELLDLHSEKGGTLFKGIRQSGAHDKNSDAFFIKPRAPAYLYGKESFRQGLRVLARRGLTYETWHYHHQNEDFCELAQIVPECTMILDHFGTPLGVNVYANCRDEIFQQWKEDIRAISRCPNVYAKLGGLAMPDNGFGWDKRALPPTSDEFVAKQKRYYLHTIECFGPGRCMFESNFPVDRLSLAYPIVWNGFKKMVADFSEAEKHAMFYGTAEKVYRLQN